MKSIVKIHIGRGGVYFLSGELKFCLVNDNSQLLVRKSVQSSKTN